MDETKILDHVNNQRSAEVMGVGNLRPMGTHLRLGPIDKSSFLTSSPFQNILLTLYIIVLYVCVRRSTLSRDGSLSQL